MPWYYAGPEAKPVGPISLDELQALRVKGTILPETYVIEQTGQPPGSIAWKRYQELFPANPVLPPVPPPAPPVVTVPPVVTAPLAPQPHPLFPSASSPATHAPVFTPGARPDPYYQAKPTNGWCAWGFGLGLAAFFPFSFLGGIGLLFVPFSIPSCLIGLLQLSKHREQKGHWLAIWGLVFSILALIVVFLWAVYFAMPFLKAHGLTVTEQTTNDSE